MAQNPESLQPFSCGTFLREWLAQSDPGEFERRRKQREAASPRQLPESLGAPIGFLYPDCMEDPKFLAWSCTLDENVHEKLVDEIIELEMDILGESEEVREMVRRDAALGMRGLYKRPQQT